MQAAFANAALRDYVEVMTPRIAAILDAWRGQDRLLAFPTFKALTLDLASMVFLGVDPGDQLAMLTRAFEDVTKGVTALVPVPLPGTALRRALGGRALLSKYLRTLIAERRRSPGAPNLLSQLCLATDEQGNRYTDDEIINHMIFVWMAAHDTTTGSLVMLAYELARDQQWQERLRSEASGLGSVLRFDKMNEAKETEWVIHEVLRLYPPVASLPRRTLRPCVMGGVRLPADTPLRASVLLAQRHPALWTRPHCFDPQRFSPERAEHRRHKYSFRPFGGGAHMCMGMRFAMLQLKGVLHQVLLRYRLVLPPGYQLKLRPTPSFRPADDLPLGLVPLSRSGAAATRFPA
jgi:cytochrome P450